MVTFTYRKKNYDFTTLQLSIENENFDLNKALEFTDFGILSPTGEFCRLFLEILPHNGGTTKDFDGNPVAIPPRPEGINALIATAQEIIDFLNAPTIPMSESLRSLLRRILAWRFPTEFDSEIKNVSTGLKTEYDLIKNSTKSITFLGESGYFDKVRLDGKRI